MRRICLGLLSATSIVALTSIASAADLRVKAPPPPPPPPVWSWTGFYIGAHIGAGWSTVESDITDITVGGVAVPLGGILPLSSHNLNGFIGGGQIGYNWQSGWVVFGVEAEISASGIEGRAPCLVVFQCRTETDWIATVAGRLGFVADKALVYVKGGVAWSENDYSATLNLAGINITGRVEDTRVGALLGAGVEYAFAPNWSAKVEYNYIDFGDERYNVPITTNIPGAPPINVGTEIRHFTHTVKFGVNYRFGWGGPGPLMARY